MTLLARVANALRETGKWKFSVDERESKIEMSVSDEERTLPFIIRVREEVDIIIAMIMYQRKIPEEYREEAIAYISKRNFEMIIGGFELSDAGRVLLRTSLDVEQLTITPTFMNNLCRIMSIEGMKCAAVFDKIIEGKRYVDK